MIESSLEYLLGTYFHQDYALVTGDERATVHAFLEENPDEVTTLLAQLEVLTDESEADLERLADAAGCQINPTYTGETWHHWFKSIEAQARAYAAEHPQPRDPGAGR